VFFVLEQCPRFVGDGSNILFEFGNKLKNIRSRFHGVFDIGLHFIRRRGSMDGHNVSFKLFHCGRDKGTERLKITFK